MGPLGPTKLALPEIPSRITHIMHILSHSRSIPKRSSGLRFGLACCSTEATRRYRLTHQNLHVQGGVSVCLPQLPGHWLLPPCPCRPLPPPPPPSLPGPSSHRNKTYRRHTYGGVGAATNRSFHMSSSCMLTHARTHASAGTPEPIHQGILTQGEEVGRGKGWKPGPGREHGSG